MSDEPDDIPTDEELRTLRAQNEASSARLNAKLDELERLGAAVDRAQARVFERRPPDAVEPETPQSRLAAADAHFQALVADPLSSQEARKRALILRDRAQLAADKDANQTANLGRMLRSLDVRATEQAKRDAAEREAAARQADFERREDERRWGHARRQKYIGG